MSRLKFSRRFIKLLEVRCLALIDMPNLGRRRDELAPELRSVTEGKYVILYLGTADGIYIVRVLHSKQDIENQPLIDKE